MSKLPARRIFLLTDRQTKEFTIECCSLHIEACRKYSCILIANNEQTHKCFEQCCLYKEGAAPQHSYFSLSNYGSL